MIRLRFEIGRRQRLAVDEHRFRNLRWIDMALISASLQARAITATGRKHVPLMAIVDQDWVETARSLYENGLVELRAWDDDGAGRLKRIRSVDLSLAAAQALQQAGHVPRCFVPALVAHDLLIGHMPLMNVVDSQLLGQEFAAWLECGGLSVDLRRQQVKAAGSSL